MANQPQLSFVIPAYNEELYIKQCLESIAKEIGSASVPCEIIVVNNASTDNTEQIALSIPGVKVVNEPRKGLSQARQTGFVNSTGPLVANIDADCILPAGWIATVINSFEKDPQLVVLSGPQIFYDSPAFIKLSVGVYHRVAFISYLLNRYVFRAGSLVQGGNFIIRRTALEKVGGFNPEFSFYGEDVDIARRLPKVGRVVFKLSMPIHASGRRVNKEGLMKMAFLYPINYFWTIFFGKPFTKTNTDVRTF